MPGPSVEMISNIIAQLAGQGSMLQGNNTANMTNIGLAELSTTIMNEDEVLLGNCKEKEFTMEELLSTRKKKEKATNAQQTFSVGNNSHSVELFCFETAQLLLTSIIWAPKVCIKNSGFVIKDLLAHAL